MYTARHTQLRALQARKQCLLDVDVEGGDHREHQNSRENIKTSCSSMQQFYYYFFFSLEKAAWSSFWLTVAFDSRSVATSQSPITMSKNKLPLVTRTWRKAKAGRDRGGEKPRGLDGVGLCFPWKRPLLKYKMLDMSFQTGCVVKGMKSGRILEGHLTALHFQCKCWLRNPTTQKMSLHGLPALRVIYPWTPIY